METCYLLAMGEVSHSIAVPLDRARPRDADEAALVQELQQGSEEAFAYLIAIYHNPVYNLAYHITGNDADSADVLQNVFIKIFRGIKQFHGACSLKTWIYRIVVREALNTRRGWFRRRRREAISLDDEQFAGYATEAASRLHIETPYDVVEQNERKEMVARALHSLSEPYRTVVVLREVEDLSYEEITEVLGIAEGTVKSRLKRGRELLRRKLAGSMALER
ncbi:MAG: sigma-70 family RNA polymerase sigma factor [Acidobacteriota bacterium]|nr:sigma-70 family RNA polymerase sigma factor [Acidobacteriota bacterium]